MLMDSLATVATPLNFCPSGQQKHTPLNPFVPAMTTPAAWMLADARGAGVGAEGSAQHGWQALLILAAKAAKLAWTPCSVVTLGTLAMHDIIPR